MGGRRGTYQGPHVPHRLAREDVREDIVQVRIRGGGGHAGREVVVPRPTRDLTMHKETVG